MKNIKLFIRNGKRNGYANKNEELSSNISLNLKFFFN